MFSNGTTGPKQITKSTKSKFATPKVGEVQRVRSRSLALQKTNNEPENKKPKNQETRKPRNPKTKKQKKKTKAKKNKIAHPKGGVVAESWVLSFCFSVFFVSCFFLFFLILVFFSHYRKTKQKLSMVAKQWENHSTCAVSVDARFPGFHTLRPSFMIPSGYVKIAIENGPLIVFFPIKNGDCP